MGLENFLFSLVILLTIIVIYLYLAKNTDKLLNKNNSQLLHSNQNNPINDQINSLTISSSNGTNLNNVKKKDDRIIMKSNSNSNNNTSNNNDNDSNNNSSSNSYSNSNSSNLDKLLKHDVLKISPPVNITFSTLPSSKYYFDTNREIDGRYYQVKSSLNDVFRYNPAPDILPGGLPINQRTRGDPTDIRQIGFLSGLGRISKILPLYGYQTHSGSNQWIYFTNEDLSGILIKIPIEYQKRNCLDNFCREIYDGDIVQIPSIPYESRSTNNNTNAEESNHDNLRMEDNYKATIYKLSLYH